MKFGTKQIGPTLLNILSEADSHAKLKVAAIRTIGCLVQNHQGKGLRDENCRFNQILEVTCNI